MMMCDDDFDRDYDNKCLHLLLDHFELNCLMHKLTNFAISHSHQQKGVCQIACARVIQSVVLKVFCTTDTDL